MIQPDCIDTIPVHRPSGSAAPPSWRQWAAIGLRKAAHDLTRCVLTIEIWSVRSRERRRLLALDPRMLQDIGASGADVWAEARKPFWRA